jgi:hypothetical protein
VEKGKNDEEGKKEPVRKKMEFYSGWFFIELPGYRDHQKKYSTYSLFSYEELPPIEEEMKGDYAWLEPLEKELAEEMESYQKKEGAFEEMQLKLERLQRMAQKKKIGLPSEFVEFMESEELQKAIPSCTACYFDLSNSLIASPFEERAYMIRFMNDQQGCLFWYLYLQPTGEPFVLVTSIFYDNQKEVEELSKQTLGNYTFYCASSFEAFIYRFWFENLLWFDLNENNQLTKEQQNYLQQYHKKE